MLNKLITSWYAELTEIFHWIVLILAVWFTAAADPEQFPGPSKWIIVAVVGVLYVLIAGAFTTFIRMNENLEAIREQLERQ